MLLSLLGFPTSRRLAMSLFGLRGRVRGYQGTALSEIAALLSHAGVRRVRWEFSRQFSFPRLLKGIQKQSTHQWPTLIWFGAVHADTAARATHIAVVLGADAGEITLLDPLGKHPASNQHSNVFLTGKRVGGRLLYIRGVNYHLNSRAGAALLRYHPPA